MSPKTPRVELLQNAAAIDGETVRSEAEGLEFWSGTNSEILAGKWKWRRELMLITDVFDFGVAGLEDGPALQRALPPDQVEVLTDQSPIATYAAW